MPQWLALPPKVPKDWYHNTLVLEGDYRNSADAVAMSFSAGGYFLAACSHDGAIRIWETATGVCTAEVPERKCELPIAIAFSNDNKYLAVAYFKGIGNSHHTKHPPPSLVIYNAKTGTPEADIGSIDIGIPSSTSLRLAFGPDLSNRLFLADFHKNVLKVVRMNIDSRTIEETWSLRPPWTKHLLRASFVFSSNASRISILSPNFRSITSWNLVSGKAIAYGLEAKTAYPDPKRHKRFIESHGRDLIYHEAARDPREWPTLQKLDVETGRIEHLAHFGRAWDPHAYASTVGKIAFVETSFGVIHVRARPRRPKSNRSADQQPTPTGLIVAQDTRMVLVKYIDHLELRDLAGNAVFTSGKAEFQPPLPGDVYVSEDCRVIAARIVVQSYPWTPVWFTMPRRELQLPGMGVWACPPVVSGDGRLMAFCSKATTDSPDEHASVDRPTGSTIRERFLLWDLERNRKILDVDRSQNSMTGTERMLFSDGNATLRTNQCSLDLKTGKWNADNLHTLDDIDRSSPISMDGNGFWLRYRDEEMLWLPEAYRPMHKDRAHSVGNTIAYACRDKSVVVMKFTES